MPSWNFLIIPVVAGYYIITRCKLYKFKQQRLDKQRLIFDSIFYGIMLLVLTFFAKNLLCKISFINDWVTNLHSLLPIKENHFGTTCFSFAFALIYVWFFNKRKSDNEEITKAIYEIGSELEKMLMESFWKSIPLQFTLDTGKVYIAMVTKLPIPIITNYIKVIPLLSGFRGEDKSLLLTTKYTTVYKQYFGKNITEAIKHNDLALIITLDNIVSVSYFNSGLYNQFKKEYL